MDQKVKELEAQLAAANEEVKRQMMRRQEERKAFDTAIQDANQRLSEMANSSATESQERDVAHALLALGGALQQNAQVMNRVREETATQRIIMPNPQNAVRDFLGTESPEAADAWLRELEITKNIHNWSDAVAFNIAKGHLKGAALKWYLTRVTSLNSYDTLTTSFKATFTKRLSKSDKLRVMSKRSQLKNETLQEYVLDKIWLCDGLELDTQEIRDEVADGLWSKELANHILAKDYATTDDMLQDMIKFEMVSSHRRERYNFKNSMASGKQRVSTPSTSDNVNNSEESRDSSSSSTNDTRKCNKCKQIGHLARDCKNKRSLICYACKAEGHIAKNCPLEAKPVKPNVNVIRNNNLCGNSAKDEKFFRNVLVNGVKIMAEIDIGAEVNTIKSTAVLMLDLKMTHYKTLLGGFGESEVISPGTTSAELCLENLKPKIVEFRVVPDNVQEYDLIIGRPFTEALDVTYKRVGYELEFSNIDPTLFHDRPIPVEKTHSLEELTLPKNTINFIKVKTHAGKLHLPVTNFGDTEIVKVGAKIGEKIMSVHELPGIKVRSEPVTKDEVIADENVSNEQKEQIVNILNLYSMCVARNVSEIGCTNALTMDIEVENNKGPVQSKPYKLKAKDRDELDQIVDEYKKLGIVKETSSEYASPAFIVRKKDGTPRMVIDYRKLNKITKRVHFPIPNFEELLTKLNEAKFFITIDLAHGYLQMPLTENAKAKTAFITEKQTGEFERAMFGLACAPMFFAKMMEKVLGVAHKKGIAFTFFDDTCIYANSWDDLMNSLVIVLQLLKEARLTINLSKCRFGMRVIEYLGFLIGNGTVQPGVRKIDAISKFPRPNNIHEIRRFIDLCSFFRRFIPFFAQTAEPLTSLLKAPQKYVWTDTQEKAFNELKNKLSQRPILHMYNPDASRTELHTDASALGLAAMLFQADEKDDLRLVYAVSRRTSDTEKSYHSSRLELLAIAWSLSRLRSFLIGIKFVIVTDCQCLININAWKTQNAQIARWASAISEYDFEIKYRKGTSMLHVDALSRAPVENAKFGTDYKKIYTIRTREDEILMFQRKDPIILQKIQILSKPLEERSKTEKSATNDFVLKDGLLFKITKIDNVTREVFVVPRNMRKALVIRYHDLNSHFGVFKTLKRMQDYYYFSGMKRYIRVHIKNCMECILTKRKFGKQEGELHPISPGTRPFQIIHMDHLGPFPTTPRKNKYILGIIDNLTKYAYIVAVRSTDARTTVNRVREFIERFGAPERIISDRDTCFTSHLFDELCNTYKIKHTLNSSRHPRANGLIERLNQTMLPAIKVASDIETQCDWNTKIKKLERDINSTISKSTGKTPFEALYGYLPRFEDANSREITNHCETYILPSEVQKEIRENIIENQANYKKRFDQNRYRGIKYDIGDIVFVKKNPVATGESCKLQQIFGGPMVVVDTLPSDTYRIKKLNSCNDKKFESTAHVSQMKIWSNKNDSMSESDESDNEAEYSSDENYNDAASIDDKTCNLKEKMTAQNKETVDNQKGVNQKVERPQRIRKAPKKLDDYECV
ncbi:hypothetical protein TKK_0013829 [Trichogramma kaykai]